MRRVIRVFPQKTSMTPDDAYVFIGDPPLWRPEADEIHVSVTFIWDLDEAERLHYAWSMYYPVVRIGGPAYRGSRGEFIPGMYLKQGVTITSRGCVYKCPWCLVPDYEGELKTLEIKPGWIIQDNNLLATPRSHQEQVYAMLKSQKRTVSFPGGLDCRLIDDWVISQLKELRIKEIFLAADTNAMLQPLRLAVSRLSFLKRHQLRCYVLLAYNSETIEQAGRRLEAVWDIGCLPFAQLYRPEDGNIQYSQEWKSLARAWSRPAIMIAMHKVGR